MEKEITTFELISNLVYKICKGELEATFIDNNDDKLTRISIPKLNILFEISHNYDVRSGENFFLIFNSPKGSEKFLLEKDIQRSIINMITDTIWHLKQKSYQEILKEIGGINSSNNND